MGNTQIPEQGQNSMIRASHKGDVLLTHLCDEILQHTILDPRDPWCGGVRCNLDLRIETRGAEACYAMAYLYKKNGDERYRACAKAMTEFLLNRQALNGWWLNEGGSTWRGTTVFMALALAEVYPFFQEGEPELGNNIQCALEKATNFLTKAFRVGGGNINYRLTLALVLWMAGDILNRDSLKQQARGFGELIFAHLNEDGFLFGEGHGQGGELSVGSVDVGYGLGMSLGAVAIYALKARHEKILDAVMKSTKAHLEFLYPDGSLDNSWGSRCYKWTLSSSKTVHGLPMVLLSISHLNPMFLTAFHRHCNYLERFFLNGQLQTGPHFHKNPDYLHSCIHMTFSHACGLASGLIHLQQASDAAIETKPLPCDLFPRAQHYQSLNVIVHRAKSLMATVTGSGQLSVGQKMFPTLPSGGCLSYLWSENYGPIQVGSQYNYQRIEPMNMPESFDKPGNLTPRVEFYSSKGMLFSSVFEREANLRLVSEKVSQCRGHLKNFEGNTSGVEYVINYEFRDSGVRKTYQILDPPKGFIFIREPIVFDPDLGMAEQTANSLKILGEYGGLHITSPWQPVWKEPTRQTLLWCPFPSVYGLDVKFEYEGDSFWVDIEAT